MYITLKSGEREWVDDEWYNELMISRNKEIVRIRELEREFINEIPLRTRKTLRNRYLRDESRRLETLIEESLEKVNALEDEPWVKEFIADRLEIEKNIQKLTRINYELQTSLDKNSSQQDITAQDIHHAKNTHIFDLYPDLRPSNNGRTQVNCPFHEDSTPSLKVYPAPRGYYCFGCHAGGDTIDFVMRREDLSFINAIKFIIKK